MILQACIDESATNPRRSDGNYLLGGLIASAEDWALLSNEWSLALKEPPVVEYFKLSQALAMKHEFDPARGWSEETRNERVMRLAHITRRHVRAGYTVIVPREAYNKFVQVHARKHVELTDPYYFCFFQIIDAITQSRPWLGGSHELHYFFDEQGAVGARAIAYWQRLKLSVPWKAPVDLGAAPAHRNDKTFPPLQAADLWAGLVRGIEEEMLMSERMGMKQQWLNIFDGLKVNERKYSEAHLMELAHSIRRSRLS